MARTKSKPRGSKAKELDFEDDYEIDDYSEIDNDFSEENIGKQKEKNIFGKAYNWLETKYYSFSNWLTKKGINLNKVNNFLEEKGIPAFVFVAGLTIIILAILLFLIINFATKTTVEFSIVDFSGNKLTDVDVSIYDLKNKVKFSEVISDGHKVRLSLKSGVDYLITATKSGYADFENTILFTRGEKLPIRFSENVILGNFKLSVTDSETKKSISKYKATLKYTISGKSQEQTATPGSANLISFTDIPLGKSLSLIIEADGYQTVSQSITVTTNDEIIPIELQFDLKSAQLEGIDTRGTVIAVSDTGEVLDDCDVTIYNLAGEIIAQGITQLGKFTFNAKAGSVIRYVVTKEDYQTYDSDKENKTFRLQKSEDTFTATLKKGSSNLRVLVVEDAVGPVSDVDVSLYNNKGNLITEKTTLLDGEVIFTGLEKGQDYVVTACKEDYLCSQYFANIEISNDLEIRLVRFGSVDTYKLSIYVYDGANTPLSTAKVLIYKLLNGKYVPIGLGPLQVDLTGYTSIFTQKDETYKVVGIAGDSNASQEITIDKYKDNKVILIINEASKEVTLQLKDIFGNPVTDGHVTVKSKTGDILYEGYIDAENPAKFSTKGYKDIVVEYMDNEGNVTVASGVVGDDDILTVSLKPMIEDFNPIISFLEIRDLQNKSTSIISKDYDYYLVFDLQLPIEVKKCGVHFRAGKDSENDSENMTYGITGFKADTTSFKYSTTYREGQQSIDFDNVGSPNTLNKWLELYWSSESLSNKQIMLKVKATEVGDLLLKYRAWCEDSDGKIYRDPEDSMLGTTRNNATRQNLYAETKEQVFKVHETPAECSNDLCIDYRFLDKDGFDYPNEEFFGTVDDMYLLELNYYSIKSGELKIDVETDASHPIIGLINYQETNLFPSSKLDSQETKLSSMPVSLQSGITKKQYLLFNAKNTGVTYIDVKSTFNSKVTEKRLTFEIKNKRNLMVNVLDLLPYNTPITIEVKDADNKNPINNALVKLEDEFGDLISSTKKAKAGKYILNQNFSSSKPNLTVTAPGYIPYTKQLMIAETGLISGPDSININFGNEISQETEVVKLVNKGNAKITDLTYKITPIDEVSAITIETQLPITLNPGSPVEIEVVSVIDPKIKFTTAKYVLTIFGFVGNKQVAKDIEINIYKGQVQENCLDVKPLVIYSYVGISEGSENEITATLVNNCKKVITITPELLKAKGTMIKKDEDLEIMIPSVTIEPNEEITDYTITIKNNKARKHTKSYAFEIAWRNAYYALPNTKLNVDLVDYTKTIKVTPPVSVVSMSQFHEEIAASNKTVFSITNTGKYSLRDVQISRLEEKYVSNIQDKIEPLTFEEIKPGQTKQVSIIYEGKVKNATRATMYYKVSANSPGTKDPITAKFTVDFRISSASCLKIDQKKIAFYTKIGEERVKLINVTNHCAEPISYIDFDPNPNRSPNDFTLAFGEGTGVALIPAIPTPFIGVNQTVPFYLKVKPTKYFTPRPESRFTLVGIPLNSTALSMVTSEIIWVSTEVEAPDEDTVADLERIDETVSVKVCDSDERMDVSMPKIVTDCKDDGYCDAEGAAELILEKIQELHNVVIDVSRQLNNELLQTNCSIATAHQNGCAISDLLKPDQLKQFKNIPIYLQNDSLSQRTLEIVLNNTKDAAKKYPTIKNYAVRENVGVTSGGLQMIGNIIHVDNKMQGCGRYKISIDGRIATKDQKTLAPEKAYFFVTIDYNKTGPCTKSIENVRMYLPKDAIFFKKSNMGNTWLTIISGEEKIGKPIAKQVFDSDERFQLRTDNIKKFNQLDVSVGEIKENENAIAKLYFNDPIAVTAPRPEKINLIVNDVFSINKEGEETKYSDEFIKQVSENVKDVINGTPADICISKDKDYMLILSFEAVKLGALSLKAQHDKVQLTPLEKCVTLTANSAVDEQVTIKAEEVMGVRTKFNYSGQDYTDRLLLVLEKDKPIDFNVCFLGDISDVVHWSDKKVKIVAESKYKTGKTHSNRSTDINITLLNYGITPMQLIKIADSSSSKLNSGDAESDEKTFYAFVSWDDKYNKSNKEEYCEALKKYYESLGGKGTMFIKPEECNFKKTESEESAINSRARKRSLIFFGGCFGSCAVLTYGADTAWNAIPFFGQVMYISSVLKDLFVNCSLGCGIPALLMYGEETGKTAKAMETIYNTPVLGDIAKFIGGAINFVGNIFSGGRAATEKSEAIANQFTQGVDYSEISGLPTGTGITAVGVRDAFKIKNIPKQIYPSISAEGTTSPTYINLNIDELSGIEYAKSEKVISGLAEINPTTNIKIEGLQNNINPTKLERHINYLAQSEDLGTKYWFNPTADDAIAVEEILKEAGLHSKNSGFSKLSPKQKIDMFYKISPENKQKLADILKRNSKAYKINPNLGPDDLKGAKGWFDPHGGLFAGDIEKHLKSGHEIKSISIPEAQREIFNSSAKQAKDKLQNMIDNFDDIYKDLSPDLSPEDLAEFKGNLRDQIMDIDEIVNQVNSGTISNADDVIDSIDIINKNLSDLDEIIRGPAITLENPKAFMDSINKTTKGIDDGISQIDDAIKNATDPELIKELTDQKANLGKAKDNISELNKKLSELSKQGDIEIDPNLKSQIDDALKINDEIIEISSVLSGKPKGTITAMDSRQLKNTLDGLKKSTDRAGKELKKLDAQIESMKKSRSRWTTGKRDMYVDNLTKKRNEIQKAINEYAESTTKLTNAQKELVSGKTTVEISDDVLTKIDDASQLIVDQKLPTKFRKISTGLMKMGVDMLVVGFSNNIGKWTLNNVSKETGQLSNLVYVGIPVSEFEKNVWYEVTITKQATKYNVDIIKQTPAISNGVAIYYTDNKEIKEIQTSEHQEELLQSNTPQVQSQDLELNDEKANGANQLEPGSSSHVFNENIGSAIVKQATEYIDRSYNWGGRNGYFVKDIGKANTGLDCVGLQYVVLRDLGYLDDSASCFQMFSNACAFADYLDNKNGHLDGFVDYIKNESDLGKLRPGDLLSLNTKVGGVFGHAGIYVGIDSGKHKYIHASGSKNVSGKVKYDYLEDKLKSGAIKYPFHYQRVTGVNSNKINCSKNYISLYGYDKADCCKYTNLCTI